MFCIVEQCQVRRTDQLGVYRVRGKRSARHIEYSEYNRISYTIHSDGCLQSFLEKEPVSQKIVWAKNGTGKPETKERIAILLDNVGAKSGILSCKKLTKGASQGGR